MARDDRPADEIPCRCGDERNQHAFERDGEGGVDWLECVALGGCAEEDGEVCTGYRPAPPETAGPARYAKCPECKGNYRVIDLDGTDVFEAHTPVTVRCEGSGWLVEDEDRVHGRWPRD